MKANYACVIAATLQKTESIGGSFYVVSIC
jgi:hypothetical protein